MEISFASAKVAEGVQAMKRRCGVNWGRNVPPKLQQRLAELAAAEALGRLCGTCREPAATSSPVI